MVLLDGESVGAVAFALCSGLIRGEAAVSSEPVCLFRAIRQSLTVTFASIRSSKPCRRLRRLQDMTWVDLSMVEQVVIPLGCAVMSRIQSGSSQMRVWWRRRVGHGVGVEAFRRWEFLTLPIWKTST